MKTLKVSQSQKEKIKEYEKQFQTITDFKEAVRKKPGQYIGPIGALGFRNMIREILQNAFDEIIKKASLDKIVFVYFDENDYTVSIQDSGRGIPFNQIITAFHAEHTSTNYESRKNVYSSGNHGEGGKVTNILSSYFSVESHIFGEGRKVEFNEFIPGKIKKVKVEKDDFQQGTRIIFKPCYFDNDGKREVLGKFKFDIGMVIDLIKILLPTTPIGTTVLFTGKNLNGEMVNATLENKIGILTYIKTPNPLVNPFHFFKDNGTMMADIAFTFDSNSLQGEQIIGFANFCKANGSHITGTVDGICKYFRDYMNKVYLIGNNKNRKDKLNVTNADVKAGLRLVISAAHINPIFTGQSKETLSNNDMVPFTKNLVMEELDKWSKSNPSKLNYICSYLKGIAEIRVKSDKGKFKLSKSYKKSALSNFPIKYEEPTGKEELELLIVEGDSAAGSAKLSRCKPRQGIMPIKGKIPNAFDMKEEDFIANEEIHGLIVIIGNGDENNYDSKISKRKFDINKVPFKKIIIMPDADPDGAHIRTLVLRFLMVYMSPLFEAGMVYAAVPPLFGIKLSATKMKYFVDRKDYIDYIEKLFIKNNQVQDQFQRKLSHKDISEIFYNNEEYSYDLDKVAHHNAIDPYALELILIHWKDSMEKKIQSIESQFRFAKFSKINGLWMLGGNVNRRIHRVVFRKEFLDECERLYNKYIVINNSMYFILNGTKVSLYEFIKDFNDAKPGKKTFIRYKGLGEMDETQLAESTFHPDSPYGRTLIQYTIDDAAKEIDRARYLNKNKSEFIKNLKQARIIDLIG